MLVYIQSKKIKKENMKATKTENETIQRYLVDLRIQGHTKGA